VDNITQHLELSLTVYFPCIPKKDNWHISIFSCINLQCWLRFLKAYKYITNLSCSIKHKEVYHRHIFSNLEYAAQPASKHEVWYQCSNYWQDIGSLTFSSYYITQLIHTLFIIKPITPHWMKVFIIFIMQDLRFSQQCCWWVKSSGMPCQLVKLPTFWRTIVFNL